MEKEYLAGERAVTRVMRGAQKDLVTAWRGEVEEVATDDQERAHAAQPAARVEVCRHERDFECRQLEVGGDGRPKVQPRSPW